MYGLLMTLHILVSVALIVVVLVQSGRSAGMGGIFGGGSSDALFSAPSGSSFIRKLTVGLAVAFLFTTLLLTVLQSRKATRSVFQRVGTVPMQGQ